ncbi:hypothetical protein L596_011277 [Steinernema carpocapsae]|uniref:DUF19 domain-containing protein n=1 Tax=Steinernema carpocapsae TaxID=34508 RepID=A0A4U5NUC3_STECR|nr:hypothetical protein L596_011277 [Steinernema carpocapsae]
MFQNQLRVFWVLGLISGLECNVAKLRSCYDDYFGHFGMSVKNFPSHDHFIARIEQYITNEPLLARPTLCSWHRTFARCIGPALERGCLHKEALKSALGLSDPEAFNYPLTYESNQYQCGEGYATGSKYFDCLEEVRTCDKSEVNAAVQGCKNLQKSSLNRLKTAKAAEKKCRMEKMANECLIKFVVNKCGKAVEKYFCKVQEFIGKKKVYENPSNCMEAYRCDL